MKVLFVCAGNICRSPFAAADDANWAEKAGSVDTAGAVMMV